jgi:hypothetical protein
MTPEQREQWSRQWQRETDGNSERDKLTDQLQKMLSDSQSSGAKGNARAGDPEESLANAAKEDVDLRGESPGEQVLAQWLGEADDVSSGATGTATATQRVEQAQKAAERAVDDAAVPSRYHSLIKRIFGRLDETTRNAAGDGQGEKTSGGGK